MLRLWHKDIPRIGRNDVNPHNHLTAVHILAPILGVVALLGTLHLLALSNRNRASRAFIAAGF
jgi:hypothetical protein